MYMRDEQHQVDRARKATPQSMPIASSRPSGGTATATSVMIWLGRRPLPHGADRAALVEDARCPPSRVFRNRSGFRRRANDPSLTGRWTNTSRMRIAVVGTGIAGLGAAHVLVASHEVELFEREPRAGGHANTVDVHGGARSRSTLASSSTTRATTRSSRGCSPSSASRRRSPTCRFSVSAPAAASSSRAAGRSPRRAPPAADPALPAHGAAAVDRAATSTRVDARAVRRVGAATRSASRTTSSCRCAPRIWSTAPDAALDFPARYAIRSSPTTGCSASALPLAHRHRRQPRVRRALLGRLGGQLHLDGVRAIERDPDGVELRTGDGEARASTGVVVATHADEALALLADADRRRAPAARRVPFTRQRGRAAHRRALPAAVARRLARPGTTSSQPRAGGSAPTMTYYHEPPAATDASETTA